MNAKHVATRKAIARRQDPIEIARALALANWRIRTTNGAMCAALHGEDK